MVFTPVEEATVFQVFEWDPVELPPEDEPVPEGTPVAAMLEAKPGAGMAVVADVGLHETSYAAEDSEPFHNPSFDKEYASSSSYAMPTVSEQGYDTVSDLNALAERMMAQQSAQTANKPRVSDYTKGAKSAKSVKYGDQLCPRCSSKMVMRTNSYNGSKFYGCTRYPKCKGTRNV